MREFGMHTAKLLIAPDRNMSELSVSLSRNSLVYDVSLWAVVILALFLTIVSACMKSTDKKDGTKL